MADLLACIFSVMFDWCWLFHRLHKSFVLHHSGSCGRACLSGSFVPFECRAYIRHTRAAGPAIPVAAVASTVFANWLRWLWRAVGQGVWGSVVGKRVARAFHLGACAAPVTVQSVYAYRRRPYPRPHGIDPLVTFDDGFFVIKK